MRNWNRDDYGQRRYYRLEVLIVPMRNWNQGFDKFMGKLQKLFWSYLWGIETEYRTSYLDQDAPISFDRTYEELKLGPFSRGIPPQMAFWSYLWGIETSSGLLPWSRIAGFWSYLWGIETPACGLKFLLMQVEVLIVPMRNWNLFWVNTLFKPFEVLIVPMRNWNNTQRVRSGS